MPKKCGFNSFSWVSYTRENVFFPIYYQMNGKFTGTLLEFYFEILHLCFFITILLFGLLYRSLVVYTDG